MRTGMQRANPFAFVGVLVVISLALARVTPAAVADDQVVECIVPTIAERTERTTVETMIVQAACAVGTTTRIRSDAQRDSVIALDPPSGSHLAHGAAVALTVSDGRCLVPTLHVHPLSLDPPNGSWRRDRASMSGA